MGVKIHEDGFKAPVYSHKDVSDGYVKIYNDSIVVLHDVHGCPRNFIEYLAIAMDSNNMVNISILTKEQFLDYLAKRTDGEVTYSMHMIEKSLKKLKEKKLLIQHHRGVYQVNPEYFYKGKSEAYRIELIKKNLEYMK